jgi:methylamine dehydrogenase heavy chain
MGSFTSISNCLKKANFSNCFQSFNSFFLGLAACLVAPLSFAQITPEEISVETLPEIGENWFISKTGNGGYIFDATTGEMQGLLSLSRDTPAVTKWGPRREFYAAESYVARGVHGERTDLVSVYDYDNLSPVAEIIIPNHMARLSVRNHLGLMNNGRLLALLNMNPGHSVSIVDVQDRLFIYEVSTPGCAVIMPVADMDFLQICGDGTLQLIQLDVSGFEQNRVRSDIFFDVIDDAVFDRTARSAQGWFLITHAGRIFSVGTHDDEIQISEPWSVVPEGEDDWRPGGTEFFSAHRDTGLLYIAMHEGEIDTHHEPGTQIWVVDSKTQRRLHRIEVEVPIDSLMVTQEANPKLIVGDDEGGTHVYNALTFAFERTIDTPSARMFEDF